MKHVQTAQEIEKLIKEYEIVLAGYPEGHIERIKYEKHIQKLKNKGGL